jgi:CRP/FNR family transcriptional regulator
MPDNGLSAHARYWIPCTRRQRRVAGNQTLAGQTMKTVIQLVPTSAARAAPPKCSVCSLKAICLPQGLGEAELGQLDKLVVRRRRLERDENLYRMGEPFRNLYVVRFGHFKTYQLNAHGEQQISGLQMSGDLMGMDAIGSGSYGCGAVALDDSEVCEIPYARLEQALLHMPQLLHQFHRRMSQEIAREQHMMLFLGNMRAEQRFAVFLLGLSSRYAARGYASASFQLRMSREDIGSYLSLTIESISRLVTAFRQKGWIGIAGRQVDILDFASLRALSLGQQPAAQDCGAGHPHRGQAPSSRGYAMA